MDRADEGFGTLLEPSLTITIQMSEHPKTPQSDFTESDCGVLLLYPKC